MENNTTQNINQELENIYKEILSNNLYKIGSPNPRKLNLDDLKVFYKGITKLYELKEKYKNTTINRLELGNQISNLASNLMLLSEKIKLDIENCFYDYKSKNDFYTYYPVKIVQVLVKSMPSNGYVLKKVYVNGFGSFEDKHGTREFQESIGTAYILGDKDLLDELEDEKKYCYEDIKKITNKVYLNSNKSLIITSNYYFDSNILPNTNNLELKGTENIYCYLKDDELKNLLYKLLEYSKINGNHIDDIKDDEIILYIKNIKTKTLTNN